MNIHPKVKAGALAGAIITAAISILAAVGISLPPGADAAITAVLAVLAGYLQPAAPSGPTD